VTPVLSMHPFRPPRWWRGTGYRGNLARVIETFRSEIEQGLSQRQRAQFAAYWERHLAPDR
jgi:transcriptional regulator GlxA family with amidase domain